MADPANPTVPLAPGVPPVGPGGGDVPAVRPLGGDSSNIELSASYGGWDLFDNGGGFVLDFDSVRQMEDSKDWNTPSYPIEGGGFQTFNKVETPGEVQVVVTKGGTVAAKASFLSAVADLCASLTLCAIVTPEQTFRNMNLLHFSKTRTADSGATLLSVQLAFREARVSAVAAFTKVKAASGADNVNGGAVQTQAPTANQDPGVPPQ